MEVDEVVEIDVGKDMSVGAPQHSIAPRGDTAPHLLRLHHKVDPHFWPTLPQSIAAVQGFFYC
jgi:hypothetical protein